MKTESDIREKIKLYEEALDKTKYGDKRVSYKLWIQALEWVLD